MSNELFSKTLTAQRAPIEKSTEREGQRKDKHWASMRFTTSFSSRCRCGFASACSFPYRHKSEGVDIIVRSKQTEF